MASNKDLRLRRAEEIQHVLRPIIFPVYYHISIKKRTIPSKEQMRQHLSEDYYTETQVKFASHFHKAFFFFLFSTCMLANKVQKVKVYSDFYYTNF